MTLQEYFLTRPRGAKVEMSRRLGISKTWLSLVISGREVPSPELAAEIERLTKGKVKRKILRPDIFGELK